MSQQFTGKKAEASNQPLAQSPEIKRLEIFVGKWHTTGELVATATTPAARIEATDIYEWLPGNYALIHYAESSLGDEKINAVEIIGYDPARGAYFSPFVDDQGGAGFEEIRADGNTWTWSGENVMGAKFHRYRAVFSDDGDTIIAPHERSSDGVNWRPWMNVKLEKVK